MFAMRIWAALLIIASLAVLASAQDEGGRQEVPLHLPYDNVSNYSYPYLIPPPQQPIFLTPQQQWLRWWMQFDGGGGGGGGGGEGGEGDSDSSSESNDTPKVYVVWVVKPVEPNIYWKDKTYDVYNGWNWSNSGNGSFTTTHGMNKTDFQVFRVLNQGNYTLQLIKPATGGSFINLSTFQVNGSANHTPISIDAYGDYLLQINSSANTTLSYNTTFYWADNIRNETVGKLADIPQGIRQQNTQLPENIDPQLKELATNLTNSSLNLLQQAEKDRNWVFENIEYDLYWASNETIPQGSEMANWTLAHRKGICSHKASLFIVVARLQGIPARIATGFAGGYPSENATYIFPMFGHAWAEVYIPPYGWIPVDPTGNVTERENETTGEKKNATIEWSDAGKVELDLQFTLNKTFEKELQKIFENQTREEMKRNGSLNESQNMTEQQKQQQEQQIQKEGQRRMQQFLQKLMNLSKQNFTQGNQTNMNFTDMNWSDLMNWSEGLNQTSNFTQNQTWNQTMNQTWNQTMNWTQNQTWNFTQNQTWNFTQNQTWNYTSNFTQQGNWSQFNRTWNFSRLNETYRNLTQQNDSRLNQTKEEEKQRQDMLRNLTSFSNNTIVNMVRDITSNPNNFWLLLLAALLCAMVFAGAIYVRSKLSSRLQQARAAEVREMFRKVNIDEVIRRVKQLGAEEKYGEAMVYGYNELADYIAFVFRIINDPSKTAREFAKSVEASVDVDSLKAITFLFERTKYAKKAGKKEYDEFLAALLKLAKSGG